MNRSRISSAVRVPRLRGPRAPQHELKKHLSRITLFRLCLAIAPTGYGKTATLARWAEAQATVGPVAWITFDKNGASLPGLARRLEEALRLAFGNFDPQESDSGQSLVDIAGRYVDRPTTLVLDNFQEVSDTASLSEVQNLIAAPMPDLCVVVISRTEPDLRIEHLRAGGRVLSLGPGDFAYRVEDTSAVLRDMRADILPASLVERIHEHTDGWPIAVHAVAGAADPESAIRSLCDTERGELGSTLADCLLRDERADSQRVLLEVALIDPASPAHLAAIYGQRGAMRLLRELQRKRLLTAHDTSNERICLLPAIRQILAAEAERRLGREDFLRLCPVRIQARLDNKDYKGAVSIAFLAGPEAGADMLNRVGTKMLDAGDGSSLLRFVALLPDDLLDHLETNLLIGAADACIELPDGTLFETVMAAIDRAGNSEDLTLDRSWLRVRHLFVAGRVTEAVALGTVSLNDASGRDRSAARSRLEATVGRALMETEHWEQGAQLLEQAVADSPVGRQDRLYFLGIASLVQCYLRRGAPNRAIAVYRRALAHESPTDPNASLDMVYLAATHTALVLDRLEEADNYLHRGLSLAERTRYATGRLYFDIFEVDLLSLKGDVEAAERAAIDLWDRVSSRGEWDSFRVNLVYQWIRRLAALDDIAGVLRWEAEVSALTVGSAESLLEGAFFGRALVLNARGRRHEALGVVKEMISRAEKAGRRIAVWEAKALHAAFQPDLKEGMMCLKALLLEMPDIPYVNSVAIFGEVVRPVVRCLVDDPEVGSIARKVASRIQIMNGQPSTAAPPAVAASKTGPGTGTHSAHRTVDGLSYREEEVLLRLMKRLTYREIAEDLFISINTVRSHVRSIYRKFDVTSRGDLARRVGDGRTINESRELVQAGGRSR